jgi:hypothetical protein
MNSPIIIATVNNPVKHCSTGFFAAYLLTILFFLTAPDLNAQRLSRERNVDLWINQAGYLPAAVACTLWLMGEITKNN